MLRLLTEPYILNYTPKNNPTVNAPEKFYPYNIFKLDTIHVAIRILT